MGVKHDILMVNVDAMVFLFIKVPEIGIGTVPGKNFENTQQPRPSTEKELPVIFSKQEVISLLIAVTDLLSAVPILPVCVSMMSGAIAAVYGSPPIQICSYLFERQYQVHMGEFFASGSM